MATFNTNLNYHARVSERYKYFCMTIPKVACTRLKMTLWEMEGNEAPDKMGDIHKLGTRLTDLPDKTALEALSSWYRFAFIRNPYTRLISGYKSKILEPKNNEHDGIRTAIRTKFKFPPRAMVSFTAFVKYICAKQDLARDAHWRTQTSFLMLDQIEYDFIGRFENFATDFKMVLYKLDAPVSAYKSTDEILNKTQSIPLPCVYNKELAALVYEAYRQDFDLFGYSKDSWMTV